MLQFFRFPGLRSPILPILLVCGKLPRDARDTTAYHRTGVSSVIGRVMEIRPDSARRFPRQRRNTQELAGSSESTDSRSGSGTGACRYHLASSSTRSRAPPLARQSSAPSRIARSAIRRVFSSIGDRSARASSDSHRCPLCSFVSRGLPRSSTTPRKAKSTCQ